MYLDCWLIETRPGVVFARKRGCETDLGLTSDEIIALQIAGGVRTTIIIPLPKHPRRQADDELVRVNLASLWMPNSQGLFLVKMQDKTIPIGLGLNNRVVIVVRPAKPNAPKPQRATVDVRKKLLDLRCKF